MAVETRRRCGYRKVGGLYLVSEHAGYPCDRLPWMLTVCPCCSAGFKPARGWTWIDISLLVEGIHRNCQDKFPCPLCMATPTMGRCGLLWIGERFYKTPQEFTAEAAQLGVSRRIATLPRGFELGKTWLLLAHRLCTCTNCAGSGLRDMQACPQCEGTGKAAGIFRVFQPSRIEKIVTTTQALDGEAMEALRRRGITPVVPDQDRDHQGTAYDEEEEVEPPLLLQPPASSGTSTQGNLP